MMHVVFICNKAILQTGLHRSYNTLITAPHFSLQPGPLVGSTVGDC